jgi:hypothetical protein
VTRRFFGGTGLVSVPGLVVSPWVWCSWWCGENWSVCASRDELRSVRLGGIVVVSAVSAVWGSSHGHSMLEGLAPPLLFRRSSGGVGGLGSSGAFHAGLGLGGFGQCCWSCTQCWYLAWCGEYLCAYAARRRAAVGVVGVGGPSKHHASKNTTNSQSIGRHIACTRARRWFRTPPPHSGLCRVRAAVGLGFGSRHRHHTRGCAGCGRRWA